MAGTNPILKIIAGRRRAAELRAVNDPASPSYGGGKTPQAEGATWFVVLDPKTGVVENAYDADLGREWGHEHIKDAQEDGTQEASRWVIRPAYAESPEAAYQRGLLESANQIAEAVMTSKIGMKIITPGKIPDSESRRFTCRSCGTVFECLRSETTLVEDNRDGNYRTVKCPLPGCGRTCTTGAT